MFIIIITITSQCRNRQNESQNYVQVYVRSVLSIKLSIETANTLHFQAVNFTPCHLVRHFQILHFPRPELGDTHLGYSIFFARRWRLFVENNLATVITANVRVHALD